VGVLVAENAIAQGQFAHVMEEATQADIARVLLGPTQTPRQPNPVNSYAVAMALRVTVFVPKCTG
jgi:hypothetical protein